MPTKYMFNKLIPAAVIMIAATIASGCAPLEQVTSNIGFGKRATETKTEQTIRTTGGTATDSAVIDFSSSSSTSTATDGITGSASSSASATIEFTVRDATAKTTALDALRASGARVELQSYGDAGSFITTINDLKGNTGNYWAFYHNGEYAQQAADKTIVKNGDRLQFVYERVTTTGM